jgi:hypothetical protein
MTVPSQENQAQTQPSDKELNFRKLEAHYEQKLQQERQARLEAERIAQEASNRRNEEPEEEDDSEPYVDKKKLNKTLARFGQETKQQTQSEIQKAVQVAIQEERKNSWLNNNKDFYDVLQHAEKFAQHDPELAETILQMPEGFERQKLVYKNIKALGLHKPPEPKSTIQDKINQNQQGQYYRPSNVGTSPYASVSDFSPTGQKQAYDKMKELQSRLRL